MLSGVLPSKSRAPVDSMETEPAIIPENPWVASSRRGLPRTFQELKGLGSHDKVLPKRSQSRNLCLSSWPGDSQENAAPFFLKNTFWAKPTGSCWVWQNPDFSPAVSEGALGWYIFIYFRAPKCSSHTEPQHLGFRLLGRIHLPLPCGRWCCHCRGRSDARGLGKARGFLKTPKGGYTTSVAKNTRSFDVCFLLVGCLHVKHLQDIRSTSRSLHLQNKEHQSGSYIITSSF